MKPSRSIDYSGFGQTARPRRKWSVLFGKATKWVVVGVAVLIGGAVPFQTGCSRAGCSEARRMEPGDSYIASFAMILGLALLVWIAWLLLEARHRRPAFARVVRKNGWKYTLRRSATRRKTGALFGAGETAVANEVLCCRKTHAGHFLFGYEQLQVGSAYLQTIGTHYAPHMVIIPAAGISGKPFFMTYDNTQRIAVDEVFDRQFATYVAGGVSQKALSILTPEVRQQLLQDAQGRAIEIIDTSVFIYSAEVPTYDAAYLEKSFQLIDGVMHTIALSVASSRADGKSLPAAARRLKGHLRMTKKARPGVQGLLMIGGIVIVALLVTVLSIYLRAW